MLLTQEAIQEKNLVVGDQPKGRRATTYDATVGEIMIEGKSIDGRSFILPPRGIVWVTSQEEFHLPDNITGLATLKTTWTHQGILALNLGVIDPGWKNPLATAVVNFSKNNFEIRKGAPFFRVLFIKHDITNSLASVSGVMKYLQDIKNSTRHFSSTFLDMDSLTKEVAEKVLGLPRVVVTVGIIALFVAILSLIVPVAWTAISQNYVMPSRVDALEKAVSSLQKTNCRN